MYNGEEYLSDTLDSIIQQTIDDWECWIIDDGSVDGTKQIVEDYQLKDSRINYKYVEGRRGPYSAANIIFPYCRGEYIVRIDADDICMSNRFELQSEILDNNKNINVCGSYTYKILDKKPIKKQKKYETNIDFLKWNLLYRNMIIHSTMMLRNNWFTKLGYYPEKLLSQDWYVWIEAAYSDCLFIIDKPLVYFRIHSNQISQKSISEQLNHGFIISKNAIKNHLDLIINEESIKIFILTIRGIHSSNHTKVKQAILDFIYIREAYERKFKSENTNFHFYYFLFKIIKINSKNLSIPKIISFYYLLILKKPKALLFPFQLLINSKKKYNHF